MGEAIRYRARTQLRGRARSVLGLVLLTGFVGGLVLAAEAGARRTESAYRRFVTEHLASDVLKVGPLAVDPSEEGFLDKLEALPQVESATRAAYVFSVPLKPSGELDITGAGIGQPLAPRNGWLKTMDIPKLLQGRHPRDDRPEELAVSYLTAKLSGFKVGDHLRLATWTPDQAPRVLTGESLAPGGPVIDMTIVGVELSPGELAASATTDNTAAHFSAGFYQRYRNEVGMASGSYVRLRGGPGGVRGFLDAVRALGSPGEQIATTLQADATEKTQRSTHLPAVALHLFALATAIGGGLILAQALSRELRYQATEDDALRALGMTRTQRATVGILVVGPVAVAGSLVALALAIALSPISPIGLARVAEPQPGMSFDAAILLGGAAVMLVLMGGLGAIAAWRASRVRLSQSATRDRPSTLATAVGRVVAAPSALVGLRMGLESGQGRTAVPIRTTMAGVIVAVASVAMAFTFLASLQTLLVVPRLYGWNWDLAVGAPYSSVDLGQVITPVLGDDAAVRSTVGVAFAHLTIEGQDVQATAFDTPAGVGPEIIAGREPSRPNELALGAKTLRRLHLSIGASLPVGVGTSTMTMHVVGETSLSNLSFEDDRGLGEGAAITFAGLRQLDPTAFHTGYLVRLRPGVAPETEAAKLQDQFRDAQVSVFLARPPTDLDNFRRVNQAPIALAGVLAVLGTATLVHALLSTTRRRTRDLAILKVLGLRGRQLRAVVAWQATALAVVGVVVGLPLGVATGRWTWFLFARQLGVVVHPVVPLLAIAIAVPAAIVVANIAAAAPGWIASSIRPALILRSE